MEDKNDTETQLVNECLAYHYYFKCIANTTLFGVLQK